MADDVQDCMVRLFAHLSLALRIGAVAAALILSIGALATGNKLALAQLSVPEAVTAIVSRRVVKSVALYAAPGG